MKKIGEFLNRLPSAILYILAIALIFCFAYAFPRLAFLTGFLFHYGLIIFFIFIAIVCVVASVSSKHSNKL
jgi:hypothetical protein